MPIDGLSALGKYRQSFERPEYRQTTHPISHYLFQLPMAPNLAQPQDPFAAERQNQQTRHKKDLTDLHPEVEEQKRR